MNDSYTITELQAVGLSYLQYGQDDSHIETNNEMDLTQNKTRDDFNEFEGPDDLVFNYMDISSQDAIIKNFDENFRGCPKETFISKLIQTTSSDTHKLEEIRMRFFSEVRDRENFPYKTATLKKRYGARSKNGDTLLQKLAKDCFILYVALNNKCNDELLETINIQKSQGPRQSQNRRSSNNGQDVGTDSSNDLFLREGLARLDRDIMTMKVEFMAEIRCEIKALKDGNHQTKQNKQTLIEVKKDISEIDTDISSLATETGNNSTKIQSVKEDIDALKPSEMSVDSRITRLEYSKFSGVDALCANFKLLRKDIYDLNKEIDTVKSDIKVNNSSISDLHRSADMKKTKTKITKNHPNSTKISTDSDIDLISFVSPKPLSKFQMVELTDKEQGKSTTEHQYRRKKDLISDNSTNIDTVIDDSSMSEFSSYEMSKTIENHGEKQTQNQSSPKHIEVVISSDQNMVSLNNFRGSYESGPSTAKDHILISKDNVSLVDSARVLDDHSFNVSDHHPIIAKLTLDNTVIADTETIIKQSKYLWDVEIPSLGCSNRDIYSNIVDAIQQAETETLPHKTFVKYLKPYWTHPVNALDEHMVSKRQLWISDNRPRESSDNKENKKRKSHHLKRKKHVRYLSTTEEKNNQSAKGMVGIIDNILIGNTRFYLGSRLVTQGSLKVPDWLHKVLLRFQIGYTRFYQGSRLVTQGSIKVPDWLHKVLLRNVLGTFPERFCVLWESTKRNFRRELRNAYQKHMQETYDSLEKDIDIDQKRLWSFLNKNKKSKSCLSSLIVNGRQCSTQDDILDGWVEHFESIFKQNTESEPISDKEREITKTVEVAHKDFRGTFYNNTKLNITVNEVEKVFKSLKNNKASGLDNIEYEHLKYGEELSDCRRGILVTDIHISSPVQADDIALISTYCCNMQTMMTVCENYSIDWKFKFNPLKKHST
ncbi:unnamed protein product [Mytilus coruscus]|uniref:Uncharacterized protein n=1 Tax=Mytilus coruscus TaxID=42192 RepID=A0A6J8DYL8_MYTCO|nr:unnamed protein product [Mytilus coruscus]